MVSTKNLSKLNLVALLGALLGALGTSCFTFLSFQRFTACFAGLGVVFGLIGLVIDIVFKTIDGSVCHFGPGAYLNFSAFGILACLLLYAVGCWKENPPVEICSNDGAAEPQPADSQPAQPQVLKENRRPTTIYLRNLATPESPRSDSSRYPDMSDGQASSSWDRVGFSRGDSQNQAKGDGTGSGQPPSSWNYVESSQGYRRKKR